MPVLGLSRRRSAELEADFPALLEQAEVDLSDTAALAGWLEGGVLQRYVAGADALLLINNAGTVQPIGPAAVQDATAIARAVSLNVAAPLMLTAALAAAARQGNMRDVRVLHVSSGAARQAYAGWSVYCATKAALDQHARASALDASGLRICSLAPGIIDTDMQAEIRASSLEQFPQRARFDELKRSGQLLGPADCARRLVDYLLDARFGAAPVADLREFTG
jgi:NAD(P)-dependent dehydrogenase (short-subunit alcohol dehydrogenase family)